MTTANSTTEPASAEAVDLAPHNFRPWERSVRRSLSDAADALDMALNGERLTPSIDARDALAELRLIPAGVAKVIDFAEANARDAEKWRECQTPSGNEAGQRELAQFRGLLEKLKDREAQIAALKQQWHEERQRAAGLESDADALQGEVDALTDWQNDVLAALTPETGDRGSIYADMALARIAEMNANLAEADAAAENLDDELRIADEMQHMGDD